MRHPLLTSALALLAAALAQPVAAKDPISVTIDRAKVMRISAPAATVVIGNPAIADATIQDRQTLVLTGRITGVTNLVILDAKGELVADELVRVEKPDLGVVTVHRGAGRQTYSCNPACSPMVDPGDTADFFGIATSQIAGRNQYIQSATTGQ